MDGILDWIRDQIEAGRHSLDDLAQRVQEIAKRIWQTLARLFGVLSIEHGRLATGAGGFVFWTVRTDAELLTTIAWLRHVVVPSSLRWLHGLITRETDRKLDSRDRRIGALIGAVRTLAVTYFRAIWTTLSGFVRWILPRFATVLVWIVRYGNRVVDLVLNPSKLALWLLPALWGPLWRFLESRRVAIGQWLLRRSIAAALRLANLVEDVLAAIL